MLKETEKLEKQLEHIATEKATLDSRAADVTLYDIANKDELQKLLKRQAELADLAETAEMRWLELHEQLEALPEAN